MQGTRIPVVMLMAVVTAASGCGGGGDDKPTGPTAPVAVLARITVSLSSSTLQTGQTATASAAGFDQNGAPFILSGLAWSSSNSAVATVSAAGQVVAATAGQSQIVATSGGSSGAATLTVTVVPVASVTITPGNVELSLGGTQQLQAALKDNAGNVLTGRTISWTSSDTLKTRVSATGLLTGISAGTATITAASEGVSGVSAAIVYNFVRTGISNIRTFLEQCPTTDSVYAQLRADFEIRVDGQLVTTALACTAPISTLPIAQLTDELIAVQVLRTAYYMSARTAGRLPWTPKTLYAWMAGDIAGVNIKTAPGQLYCCDVIGGKRYISTSRQDDAQRAFKRDWNGISNTLTFYAHEIRHVDADAPAHTTGCAAFPLSTDPPGCDQTFDLNHLGSYGVQYWLSAAWANVFLNIGEGCSSADIALMYSRTDAANANSFRDRFVTGIPAVVNTPQTPGGTCLAP